MPILALLRAVAAMTPAEIREVEEAVTDFLLRVGTNARLRENTTKYSTDFCTKTYESMKIKNQ
jgi:hypothetical protein